MVYRKKKEMLYRMIFVQAWANHVGIQTQAVRDLQIQAAKLRRLSTFGEYDLRGRFDSMKKLARLAQKNDKQINPQYKTVLSHIQRVLKDIAVHKSEAPLTRAQTHERMFGTNGLICEAEDYAKEHSSK